MTDDGDRSSLLPLPKRSIATTIELPILVNMIAVSLTGAALSNIILYRTCVHSLGHTEEECKPFLSPIKTNDTAGLEEDVQRYSTYISTVKMVLEYICPAVLSMFLGVWSDTYGRKPLIVWPLFGMAMSGILIVIFAMMKSLSAWWYVATAVPFSLTGGYIVMFTGAYCYISDTSSASSSSLRMTILDATVSLGTICGSLFSTYLILTIGNVNLLLFTATLNVVSYAFANIWIMESLRGALRGGATRVLDILYVKEMTRECFKERPNNGRAQIILLGVIRILMIMIVYGLISLEYMYTRQKLHWSLRQYTTYSSVSTLISFLGGFFGVIVVQKALRLGDVSFSMIALFTATADNLLKLFAVESWYMYLGSAISLFKGLSGPLLRSFITKNFPIEDIAKIFAFLCAIESIGPMLAPVIFNSLYSVTLATFPGAIYVLSSVMNTSCLVMLGFVLIYSWRGSSAIYQTINNDFDT
ncbi:probable peptidoglycan muropeptide transporter SLC46 isoform X1 [Maniola hyperantus]|uniref:probable peptidoglycan muropeptide transporter SLC46 isoform X1 n=2 Tax=Aphantopus hyperantus TaxID=2795564 RepID=UPI00156A7295|nr:proton-coupled folate transporter-like [Maniola hyperantus]